MLIEDYTNRKDRWGWLREIPWIRITITSAVLVIGAYLIQSNPDRAAKLKGLGGLFEFELEPRKPAQDPPRQAEALPNKPAIAPPPEPEKHEELADAGPVVPLPPPRPKPFGYYFEMMRSEGDGDEDEWEPVARRCSAKMKDIPIACFMSPEKRGRFPVWPNGVKPPLEPRTLED